MPTSAPMAEPSPTPDPETRPERSQGWWRTLVGLAIFAWVLRSFIIAPFTIPSGSMLPTLWMGDYLFVAKWPYGYSKYSFPHEIPSFEGRIFGALPERGDIVVIRPPGREGQDWVKRVIGLPGDTVEVRDGALVINGEAVPRVDEGRFLMPRSPNTPCRVSEGATALTQADGAGGVDCVYPMWRERLPGGRDVMVLDQVDNPYADHYGPVRVPEGQLLLMGDNRDDSMDSRFPAAIGGLGLVPVDHLVGRALFSFWSTDGSADILKPWTWFSALRTDRMFKRYQ